MNTEKKKKEKKREREQESKQRATDTEKGGGKIKEHRESYQQGWLVKKKKKGLETENLLFLPLVSCRDCEVNGFEMEWVYELVARSQEERDRQDCFVNSDPLNFSVNLKRNVSPLSGSYSFPL